MFQHALFLYPYYNTIWQVRIFKSSVSLVKNLQPMTVYQAMSLMLTFGLLIVALNNHDDK